MHREPSRSTIPQAHPAGRVSLPAVTFDIIVLNGEPFTMYCRRSLYPYAHEIIVVEGAPSGEASIATADGHSSDGALVALRQSTSEEDPHDKVIIVTAQDKGHHDGFWPGEEDQQSRACAARATGEYYRHAGHFGSAHMDWDN